VALERFDFAKLTLDEQCWYLRVLTVSASRYGMYPAEVVAKLVKKLEPSLPSPDRRVNEELVAMFAAFRNDGFIVPALDLLEQSRTQEEQIYYSDALISAAKSDAWTPTLRERFFKLTIDRTPRWKGGSHVKPKSEGVTKAVIAMLSEEQRHQFAERIAAAQKPPAKTPELKRPFVKEWKLEDLAPKLEAGLKQKRNLENGRMLYSATTCITCHSFQGEGGLAGPDLTNAGGRYNPRDLLDNILAPSKVINEQYGRLVYEMKNGKQIVGRLVETVGDTHVVATNPTNPLAHHVRINRKDVERITPSRRCPTACSTPSLKTTCLIYLLI
jgi:putative heme-binding domain-containing protein